MATMILDGFTFFNELDLLELRLATLDKVVDRFVVVESPTTFLGNKKPWMLTDYKERFSPWWDRIVHHVVREIPGDDVNPWTREIHQRNEILRGLRSVAKYMSDVAITGDLDEIPHPLVVKNYRDTMGPVRPAMIETYYWLNCPHGNSAGAGKISTLMQIANAGGVHALRSQSLPWIQNGGTHYGGWHFSYQGGVKAIQTKLASYSHSELNVYPYNDPEWIAEASYAGVDLFGRSELQFYFKEPGYWLPDPVQRDPRKWEHMLWPGNDYSDEYRAALVAKAQFKLQDMKDHANPSP